MATVGDVAAYILQRRGEMTAMKLQKLVYYSKAWHLVWENKPLFPEQIQAWANGPVVPELYRQHRRKMNVQPGDINGDPAALTPNEAESVDAVLRFYGDRKAYELSDLTRPHPQREPVARCSRRHSGGCAVECGDHRQRHVRILRRPGWHQLTHAKEAEAGQDTHPGRVQ